MERAEGIRWDLTPLAADSQAARAKIDAVVDQAEQLQARWQGKLAMLEPASFVELVRELDQVLSARDEAFAYPDLQLSVDLADEEVLDLAAYAEGAFTKVQNAVRFFDLEWLALGEEEALALVAAPELAGDRYLLLADRLLAPHKLSASEENVLEEREPLAEAWQKLHAQQVAALSTEFDGRVQTLDELLSYPHHPDRQLRIDALESVYKMMAPAADVLAACYDAIVADRLVVDRLRRHPGPRYNTDLENHLEPAAVDTMIETVTRHYPLAQRWFTFKAAQLGVDTLLLADQYAPLGESRPVYWPEAMGTVMEVFGAFHPQLGALAHMMFVNRHVDAEPRPNKRGGAFCAGISRRHLPYVMTNYTDTIKDVVTLSHEFGHGTHFALALQHQSHGTADVGTALAEVPSTFAELITFDHLLSNETDPATRLALVSGVAEDAFPTVFRQTMMSRYEQRAYALRAQGKALTKERLSEIWTEENERYYGDSVILPDGYRLGWSYIPHFINDSFYTYAYSFAYLVALCLYARYRADRESFPDRYLQFLRAGASASPAELLRAFDIDLTDPAVWDEGFAEIERMVAEAEQLLSAAH